MSLHILMTRVTFFSLSFLCILTNRNVLAVVLEDWESWTHIGLPKIHHTNTSKWSLLIQLITQSVVIQKSTGFAKLSTNIVNCAVLHRLARAHAVSVKAIDTLRPLVVHVVLPGVAEIASTCVASVKLIVYYHRTEITFDGIVLGNATQFVCLNFIIKFGFLMEIINFLKMKL